MIRAPDTGSASRLREPRISITEADGALMMIIPARPHWIAFAFCSVWLVGWGFALGSAMASMLHHGPKYDNAFAAALLVFWIAAGIAIMLIVLRMLVRREIVTVDTNLLTITQQIGRWKRRSTYDLRDVQQLRVLPIVYSTWTGKRRSPPGRIAFTFGSRTIRFSAEVDDAEALDILNRLERRFP